MQIEIKDKVDDLNEIWYGFWLNTSSHKILLNSYNVMTRATKRHKFQSIKEYERTGPNRPWQNYRITVDEVPLTEELKQRVKNELISLLEVSK